MAALHGVQLGNYSITETINKLHTAKADSKVRVNHSVYVEGQAVLRHKRSQGLLHKCPQTRCMFITTRPNLSCILKNVLAHKQTQILYHIMAHLTFYKVRCKIKTGFKTQTCKIRQIPRRDRVVNCDLNDL